MEWFIGFIVISMFIGWLNGPGGNTKSSKPRTGSSSAGSARAQPQVQKNNSSAETEADLEQRRRQLAEAKAALWLNQEQKKIEDALPTNEMRKRFNETKAKYFPGSQPIPLLQESQDAGSPTKSSARAQSDELAIAEPAGSPAYIFDRSFQAAEVIEGVRADDVEENDAAAKEVADVSDQGTGSHDFLCATSLKRAVNELNIEKLYHFTRVSNLRSIAEHGLLSVADLKKGGMNHVKNDEHRHDKRLHGISTSISFPNSRMFYRYRREARFHRWAILELNPSVLYELDCLFCRHNAADKRISSIAESELRGVHALNSMFQEEDGLPRPSYLKEYDPTDEQAEVLVLERIDLRYVMGVILEDQHSYEAEAAVLDGSLPLRFSSTDAALFNGREYVRRGAQEVSPPANHASNARSDFLRYEGEIPF